VYVETQQEKCWLEIRSLEILSVKKEAKLSASEVTEVEEGKGDEDLRCSNLFTVCQRRRGFSDEVIELYMCLLRAVCLPSV